MQTIKVKDEEFEFDDDDRIEPSTYVDDDTMYLFGDVDHQDGNYYHRRELRYERTEDYDNFDDELYTRKQHAVLYYHKHRERLNNPKYKAAYDAIRDEMVRSCRYSFDHEVIIGELTDEDREVQTLALDIGILECGAEVVDTYKEDADYIAERLATGESLCVYI